MAHKKRNKKKRTPKKKQGKREEVQKTSSSTPALAEGTESDTSKSSENEAVAKPPKGPRKKKGRFTRPAKKITNSEKKPFSFEEVRKSSSPETQDDNDEEN